MIRRAVLLAAGRGSRLGPHTEEIPKPLVEVRGRPMVCYTLAALAEAGVDECVVVTGYREDQLRAALEHVKAPLLQFASNSRYHLGASLSLNAARDFCSVEPFLVVMADHLLSAGLLRRLVTSGPADACRVAADRTPRSAEFVAEATRLRLTEGGVTAIGKDVDPWDAIDAGAFACTAEAWRALDAAPPGCDLSTVFRALAGRGRLFAADVTGEEWYDVDTPGDLAAASAALAGGS